MSGNTISELTRRDIFDFIRVNHVQWYGRLSEEAFLDRLYDLDALPSTDPRTSTARFDLRTHRVAFPDDWTDDWAFADPRLGLQSGPDEVLLAFLAEMLHPVVRPFDENARQMLAAFNGCLAPDGWEIAECAQLSGKPVFAARRLLAGAGQALAVAKSTATTLSSDYVSRQITRMESAIQGDPELAIGTAKEFVETICRTILEARAVEYSREDDPPRLVKLVLKELQLVADEVPANDAAVNALRRMVGSLSGVAQGITELRNLEGTGHGKSAWHECAEPRHARLAVGAATALGVFLFEVYQAGEDGGKDDG